MSDREDLDRLCEEFVRRRREGEDLTIDGFAAEHPAHASDIRELFPLMVEMEKAADPAPAIPDVGCPRDETDDYVQRRLAVNAAVQACVVGGALLVTRVLDVFVRLAGDKGWEKALQKLYLDRAHTWIEVGLCLLLVAAWWRIRRAPISGRHLAWIDAALLYVVIGFGLLIWRSREWEDLPFFFALYILVLMIRTIVVPSSGWRTFCVSLPVVPAVVLTILARGTRVTILENEVPREWFVVEVCVYGTILLVTVFVAAAASRLTWFLRKQIAEPTRLGPYRIEGKIGSGGMGSVYRATHMLLKRPTAIKLINPGVAGRQGLERFEREVQQTCRLTHPNTIAVYDYGYSPGDVFYYAMELLDGRSLDEIVTTDGPMPAARVIHILDQACGALEEAHALGLIHRDVKPGNIHLCRRGRELDVVKLLDFGLVKDVRLEDTGLTQEGMYVGTPAWGAPELISAREIGPAADLYSLGAVGWFLLVGRPVFSGDTASEVIRRHQAEAPIAPSQAHEGVPPDLEDLILRCLEKNPAARPSDAAGLRGDLRRCADAGRWTRQDAKAAWS